MAWASSAIMVSLKALNTSGRVMVKRATPRGSSSICNVSTDECSLLCGKYRSAATSNPEAWPHNPGMHAPSFQPLLLQGETLQICAPWPCAGHRHIRVGT